MDLIIFDLSGFSIGESSLKNDINKINGLFSKSSAGSMLILDHGPAGPPF